MSMLPRLTIDKPFVVVQMENTKMCKATRRLNGNSLPGDAKKAVDYPIIFGYHVRNRYFDDAVATALTQM
jgi:hypothetical protein